MVFCNNINKPELSRICNVTILILIDGFLQFKPGVKIVTMQDVTILILIDGFLQYKRNTIDDIIIEEGHNPYFNRWFSAINKSPKDYWLL